MEYKRPDFLFIMDPVGSINHETDSTLLMMKESAMRGHGVYFSTIDDLFAKNAAVFAVIREVSFKPGEKVFCVSEGETRPLKNVDAVFVRKDPPFDMDYVYATYLLEIAASDTFMINSPSGIRNANEKLYSMHFPSVIPECVVSKDIIKIKSFLDEAGGEIIIKPLGKCGGEGIFYLTRGDKNINALLETSTNFGREYIMAQRYIPEIKYGDKRIILLNGEPVGAVSRIPQDDEHRGNIHAGGEGSKCELTERDRELCSTIAPRLKKDGLYFVGLDVIGNWITEINVTSPTCLVEINKLYGIKIEKMVIDFVENSLSRNIQ